MKEWQKIKIWKIGQYWKEKGDFSKSLFFSILFLFDLKLHFYDATASCQPTYNKKLLLSAHILWNAVTSLGENKII